MKTEQKIKQMINELLEDEYVEGFSLQEQATLRYHELRALHWVLK